MSVSVLTAQGWVEDAQRYSFCLYDLEVIGFERQAFIQHLYQPHPNLAAYRAAYTGKPRLLPNSP